MVPEHVASEVLQVEPELARVLGPADLLAPEALDELLRAGELLLAQVHLWAERAEAPILRYQEALTGVLKTLERFGSVWAISKGV